MITISDMKRGGKSKSAIKLKASRRNIKRALSALKRKRRIAHAKARRMAEAKAAK